MIDDIETMLKAYGQWVNDNRSDLSCKSPSQMLMRSAPHTCAKDVVKVSKRSQVVFINDDDALELNKVMVELRRHHVLLYNIVTLVYVWRYSIRAVTDYLNSRNEGRFTRISVGKLLERGHGYIERAIA